MHSRSFWEGYEFECPVFHTIALNKLMEVALCFFSVQKCQSNLLRWHLLIFCLRRPIQGLQTAK